MELRGYPTLLNSKQRLQAFKFEFMPNGEQQRDMRRFSGACRFVYSLILDVDVNKDSVGTLTPSGCAINTKHEKTQVLVGNGGTVVISGIFEQYGKDDEARVPTLGELPVLGWLFKNQQRVSRRTELLVFITPRVLAELTTQ